jgi:iron complex transport system ATP-binding protein
MKKQILEARQLSIGYTLPRRPTHTVTQNLSLSLDAGELVCLIGPNGVGKSTLLRTLAGMQPPLAGRVLLMGDDISTLKSQDLARRLSIVLTDRINVGIMPAYALVALGRYPYTDWAGKLTAQDHAAVRWAIAAVGAENLAQRNIAELSDGERQKIMIARALAQEPQLIILDEPTAFLDLPRRVEIIRILLELAHTTERAVLLSIHDLDLALRSADTIWLMHNDGTVHVGAPEDLVLSGAFEDTFRSEGVEFDRGSGSFRISTNHTAQINLAGRGLPTHWTKRALKRAGFDVKPDGDNHTSMRVDVVHQNGNTVWRLDIRGNVQEYYSLRELVSFLRREHNP